MKYGAQLFILFRVLIVQTLSFSRKGFGHQSMNRVEREEESVCGSIIREVKTEEVCSSFSLGQDYINMLSQCGPNASRFVAEFEMRCRMNSAGEFCGSIHIYSAQSNCKLALQTGSNCTAECIESLTDAGCCFSSSAFPQDLFTLCDLDFPSPCPETSLTIPPITSDPSCQTEEDMLRLDQKLICSVASPILDSLNSNNCSSSSIRSFEIQCSKNNGELCTDNLTDNSTQNELKEAL